MDLLFHRSVSAPKGFPELVSFDLGASGKSITTWATAEGKVALTGRTTSTFASLPRTVASSPTDVAAIEHSAHRNQVTVLKGVTTSFIRTQCLPNGFLVVGSRCGWTPQGIDKNALGFDRSGRLTQAATFGDGIERIGTTADGLTWVGYFDEGIFGNNGWGSPGPQPIGRHGINCFGPDLRLITHAPDLDIYDCYAMNVIGESVYACCYSDWRIRHIDPRGTQTTWTNTIGGAKHLLVLRNTVALVGGYAEERDRIVIGKLEDGSFRIAATRRLSLGGARIPSSARVAVRGHELHALIGQNWYRCELSA